MNYAEGFRKQEYEKLPIIFFSEFEGSGDVAYRKGGTGEYVVNSNLEWGYETECLAFANVAPGQVVNTGCHSYEAPQHPGLYALTELSVNNSYTGYKWYRQLYTAGSGKLMRIWECGKHFRGFNEL